MPEVEEAASGPITQEAAMLAAQLLERSMAETQSVTNQLLDRYRHGEALARTELVMVREALAEIMYQPYAPSSNAIEEAMYPNAPAVEERARRTLDREDEEARRHG